MPSPFPGMDPYLEGHVWEDFHARFITEIADALGPFLRPRYVARVEKRVYLEHPFDGVPTNLQPDVVTLRDTRARPSGGTALFDAPSLSLPLELPTEQRESYLEIRIRESGEVVTVIELISPTNKRSGADGVREYLSKRELVLRSAVNLVELDLLRGGQRLPMGRPLPACDYFVILSRLKQRPMADVWPFTIRNRMPRIPIPLANGDLDVPLDLGAAFNAVYDRAGYDYSLDYEHGAAPSLAEEDAIWVHDVLSSARGRA